MHADGSFDNAPIFNFNDGKVHFNTNRVSNYNSNYGSSSAFLPKSRTKKSILHGMLFALVLRFKV